MKIKDQNPDSFYAMSGSSPPSNESQWLNSAQAAKYLGIAVKTIYNLRSEGELIGTRMGGRGKLVFRKENLDAWVLGKTKKKPA